MSRSKHRAAKLMDGESRETQERIARFGLAWSQDPLACRVIERWEQIFVLLGGRIKFPKLTTEIERTLQAGIDGKAALWASNPGNQIKELERQTGLLLGLLARAIQEGDGAFLRHMADAIERIKEAADPERRAALFLALAPREKPWTVSEFTAGMETFGYKIGERQARRMLKDLKIRFALGKVGRPAGS